MNDRISHMGQRIIELARIATAMHLQQVQERTPVSEVNPASGEAGIAEWVLGRRLSAEPVQGRHSGRQDAAGAV